MATAASRPRPAALDVVQSFPSEIQSPTDQTSPMFKKEEIQRTPISPPPAYLDFLQKFASPALSPPPSATLLPTAQADRPVLTSHPSNESVTSIDSTLSESNNTESVATSKDDSEKENTDTESQQSKPPSPRQRSTSCATEFSKPIRPVSTYLPMSPYSPGPASARSLKRLQIPQSPYTPRITSPTVNSPMVASPLSATGMVSPWNVVYSPKDGDADGKAIGLRQTVTRYISIPHKTPVMEPVPASKKRKIEQS